MKNIGISTQFTGRIVRVMALVLAVAMASASRAADITTGLVGHWKFDETSGTTATDSSGNNYHGTTKNMDNSDWVAGKINNCLDFDGANDFVEVGNQAKLTGSFLGNYFTLAAWVWTDIIDSNDRTIFGTESEYQIRVNTGKVKLYWSFDDMPSTATLATGQWYHICGVQDGGTRLLYINGVLDTSASKGGAGGSGTTLRLGALFDSGYGGWDGKLDDMRIYNRALTAADVLELATAPYDIKLSGGTILIIR